MKNIFEYVACDLCGNNDVRFLFEKKETNPWWKRKCADDTRLDPNMEFTIVKCLNCNHVYVNPRLIPEINQDIYARYWRSHQPRTLEASEYANYVCRQLEKLGTKGRLLDFGCGWGAYLNEARKLGWEVIGIEVDAAKVKFCRENGINAVYGDLLDFSNSRRPVQQYGFQGDVVARGILWQPDGSSRHFIETKWSSRGNSCAWPACHNTKVFVTSFGRCSERVN